MMKKIIFLIIFLFSISLTAALSPEDYCIQQGYTIDEDFCVFPDGTACDLEEFYNEECGYEPSVECVEEGGSLGSVVPSNTIECCEGLVPQIPEGVVGTRGICAVSAECTGEGEEILLTPESYPCCEGLTLIPSKDPSVVSVAGICTSKCGNGICDEETESEFNCPEDCEIPCKKEGETIPIIPNPPICCEGLTLIDPKEPNIIGIEGICTAKCDNGVCESETESSYNCPEDCGEYEWPEEDKEEPVIVKPKPEPQLISESEEETKNDKEEKELILDNLKIKTKEKLTTRGNKIMIKVSPEKTVEIVSAQPAIDSISEELGLEEVGDVELEIKNEKPKYVISAKKKGKLFAIISINLNIKVDVNAENGNIEKVEKPWWSFLVR